MKKVISTGKTDRIRRALALALSLLLCLSVGSVAAPEATVAAPLPSSNGEPRHTVCHAVSAQAQPLSCADRFKRRRSRGGDESGLFPRGPVLRMTDTGFTVVPDRKQIARGARAML